MKVHLKTLGCRLNEAELETWAQAFQKSGHAITKQAEAGRLKRFFYSRVEALVLEETDDVLKDEEVNTDQRIDLA